MRLLLILSLSILSLSLSATPQTIGNGSLGGSGFAGGTVGNGSIGGGGRILGCSLGTPAALWDATDLAGADSSVITSFPSTGSIAGTGWDLVGNSGASTAPKLRTDGNCTGASGQCAQFDVTDFLSMVSAQTSVDDVRIICTQGYFPNENNRNPTVWRNDISRHALRVRPAGTIQLYYASLAPETLTTGLGWHSVCWDLTDYTSIPMSVDGASIGTFTTTVDPGAHDWHFTFGGYDDVGGGSYSGFELARSALYTTDPGLTLDELSACGATLFAQNLPSRASGEALALAPRYFGINGTDKRITGRSVVKWEEPVLSEFRFEYSDALTSIYENQGSISFEPATTGDYTFTFDINGQADAVKTFHTSTIAASNAFSVLLVGDSLTQAEVYPNQVATATTGKSTFLGTKTTGAGTKHEGWSGKHWQWFATDAGSPMTNAGVVDIANYRTTLGADPDVVVWLLGTNNIGTAALASIDAAVTAELDAAEDLLVGWPSGTVHAFVLTLPGLADDSGFVSYTGEMTSWWYFRQKMHAMDLGLIARFDGREDEDIYIIGGNASVDPDPISGDYPLDNGVHPSTAGYTKLGNAVAGFLLWKNRT